jgi:DNA polymerase III subunit delta
MFSETPVIYILHGDDDFTISQQIADLKKKIDPPSAAELNTTTLDGRTFSLNTLVNASHSMPFLANRRLVILNSPWGIINSESTRQKFLDILMAVPPTTALVLTFDEALTNRDMKRRHQTHWLEKWADEAGSRVYIREYLIPQGPLLVDWIQHRTEELDGRIEPAASMRLADWIGDDIRLADQEIKKLLEYVNRARPVTLTDVENVSLDVREGDIFKLVDSLGSRRSHEALEVFHRLLEDQDDQAIFGMVIRQFRLIIQAREILDQGGGEAELINRSGLSPYVARKVISQARNFSTASVRRIYHQLLEIDIAQKTSEMDLGLNLDLFTVELTEPSSHSRG